MSRENGRRVAEMAAEDDVLRRWFRNLERRNASTADVYLRRLVGTLERALGITPTELLAMDQDELEDAIGDCVDHELRRGVTGGTIENFRKAAASFLAWHRRKLERPIHIPGANDAPNAEASQIPSPEDLAEVPRRPKPRVQAMFALMAFCGLRPQVIGNIDASDGLRLADLPDLEIANGRAKFTQSPALVKVRRQLSKTGKPYFTFMGQEGCQYVEGYLNWRLSLGEKLDPQSPLVTPFGGKPRFSLRNNVSDSMRRVMRQVGLQEPPYFWRSYFGNRCMIAESRGLSASYRKFLVGHSGCIQARYALHKQMPEDMIEEIRIAYAKALPHLETGRVQVENPMSELVTAFLKVTGHTAEEVEALDLGAKSIDEQTDLLQQIIKEQIAGAQGGEVQQRLVAVEEMEGLLAQGWVYNAALPDGRIIVESG